MPERAFACTTPILPDPIGLLRDRADGPQGRVQGPHGMPAQRVGSTP